MKEPSKQQQHSVPTHLSLIKIVILLEASLSINGLETMNIHEILLPPLGDTTHNSSVQAGTHKNQEYDLIGK
jgi:hypothetical protein